jgi:aldehyde:ferredoxin oxidoreductase
LEDEFVRAAERICALERALQVRHWGRDRAVDEMVLPYFEEPERHQSTYLDRRYGLERRQFAPVIERFYALHGWDTRRGWPTDERLNALGLADVYQPMLDGAARAATPEAT